MTTKVDLSPWLQGETWVIECTARDVDKNPIPLEGATINFVVSDKTGAVVLNLATPASSIIVTDAAAGKCTIRIKPSLPPARYSYEFWVITAEGEATAQAKGLIEVHPSIRPTD